MSTKVAPKSSKDLELLDEIGTMFESEEKKDQHTGGKGKEENVKFPPIAVGMTSAAQEYSPLDMSDK